MSEKASITDLFTLNKNILNFIIKQNNNLSTINNILNESNSQSSNNNNNNIKYKSLCILKVTNISKNFIVFRTKTTKKKSYIVQPSHSIIKPNSTISISIEFVSKEKNFPSNSGHKFKFEAIQIFNNNLLKLEPKQIFEEIFNENNLQQNLFSKKLDVEFINEENYLNDNNNNIVNNNNKIINNDSFNSSVNESSIYKSVKFENDSVLNSNNNFNIDTNNKNNLNKTKTNKNNNNNNKSKTNNLEELNNLKVEYYKLLDQLNDISKDYNNLKNKLDKEKNLNLKEDHVTNLYNNKYNLYDFKETKISINLAFIMCIISIILGFYLTD